MINVIPAYYLSRVHQIGVVRAVEWIRDTKEVEGVIFLMPCHSTPFHAAVHREEVYMRFLTCEPPVSIPGEDRRDVERYMDEADVFYADPGAFIMRYFTDDGALKMNEVEGQAYKIESFKWPSHLLIFEALRESVREVFELQGYRLVCRFKSNRSANNSSTRIGMTTTDEEETYWSIVAHPNKFTSSSSLLFATSR